MKTTTAGIGAILGMLLIAGTAPAQAQQAQFTLNVSYDVGGLDESVKRISVQCSLCLNAECRGSQGDSIGSKIVSTTLSDTLGRFTQDFVIPMNVNQGLDPRDATHYKCSLLIDNTRKSFGSVPFASSPQPHLKPKAGTPLLTVITGRLSQ